MLHTFLTDNRNELVDRCKAKVLLRAAHGDLAANQQHGIPQFLDQLVETLRVEQSPGGGAARSNRISGSANDAHTEVTAIGATAGLHGRELLAGGYTIHEVVHHYGDLCQAVTQLAGERKLDIAVDEFETLNRCLDNAIADAVRAHSEGFVDEVDSATERQGRFMRDLRSHLATANLSFSILKAGHVGPSGATGNVLENSLAALGALVEQRAAEDSREAVAFEPPAARPAPAGAPGRKKP